MKGAYADPQRLFDTKLMNALLPSHTYGICSGGLPEVIPRLSWQNLKDFHAKHYSPDNARFYSYGNLALEDHLEASASYLPNQDGFPKSSGIFILLSFSQPGRKHTCQKKNRNCR